MLRIVFIFCLIVVAYLVFLLTSSFEKKDDVSVKNHAILDKVDAFHGATQKLNVSPYPEHVIHAPNILSHKNKNADIGGIGFNDDSLLLKDTSNMTKETKGYSSLQSTQLNEDQTLTFEGESFILPDIKQHSIKNESYSEDIQTLMEYDLGIGQYLLFTTTNQSNKTDEINSIYELEIDDSFILSDDMNVVNRENTEAFYFNGNNDDPVIEFRSESKKLIVAPEKGRMDKRLSEGNFFEME